MGWPSFLVEFARRVGFYDPAKREALAKALRSLSRGPYRMTRGNRKIGLGVMGFAEMLIRLGISYDSDAAVQLAEQLMRTIAEEALKTSQELAEKRGVFPNWKGSVFEAQNVKVRNATRTAIAPTGTLSIIAGTSASIEPLFALAYRRTHVLGGQTLYEVNPIFLAYAQHYGFNAEQLIAEVLEKGRLKEVAGVSEEAQRLFVTALEIPPERHLQIQAAFQRHIDNSVSKTINLSQEAPPPGGSPGLLAGLGTGPKGHHHLPLREQISAGPRAGY